MGGTPQRCMSRGSWRAGFAAAAGCACTHSAPSSTRSRRRVRWLITYRVILPPGRGRVRKEWGKNGQRWSQTVKISWFKSQGALPALAFLGEIRVLVWFVN